MSSFSSNTHYSTQELPQHMLKCPAVTVGRASVSPCIGETLNQKIANLVQLWKLAFHSVSKAHARGGPGTFSLDQWLLSRLMSSYCFSNIFPSFLPSYFSIVFFWNTMWSEAHGRCCWWLPNEYNTNIICIIQDRWKSLSKIHIKRSNKMYMIAHYNRDRTQAEV